MPTHKITTDFIRKYNKEFAIKGYSKMSVQEKAQKIYDSIRNIQDKKKRKSVSEEWRKIVFDYGDKYNKKKPDKPKPKPKSKPKSKPKPKPKPKSKPKSDIYLSGTDEDINTLYKELMKIIKSSTLMGSQAPEKKKIKELKDSLEERLDEEGVIFTQVEQNEFDKSFTGNYLGLNGKNAGTQIKEYMKLYKSTSQGRILTEPRNPKVKREYIVPLNMFGGSVKSDTANSRQFIWVNNKYIYERGLIGRQDTIVGQMSNEDFEDFEEAEEKYNKYNLYDVDLSKGKSGDTRPKFTSYGKALLKKDGFK